jgi:hypothetical protein
MDTTFSVTLSLGDVPRFPRVVPLGSLSLSGVEYERAEALFTQRVVERQFFLYISKRTVALVFP